MAPPKKDPAARIRRNKTPPSAAAKVVLCTPAGFKPPKVPTGVNKGLWASVWADPSAPMWTAGDVLVVERWCRLSVVFGLAETPAAAAATSHEMRQLEAALGLGAVARAKLGWVVVDETAAVPVHPSGGAVVDSAARFKQRAGA